MTREMFLADAFDLDPEAAASLVEALIQLGAPVDARLRSLAGFPA
jgi:hypothetical protein